MVDKVVERFEVAYPDLKKNLENIRKIVKIEEEKFSNTLDQGIQLVNQEIDALLANGKNKLDGEVSFKLYDTYGFPYELTEEIAEERGVTVLREEFEAKMEEQKEKARSAREVVMEKGQDSFIEDFYDKHGVTKFTGYEKTEDEATLLSSREAKDGKYLLIFDKTPFYAESGGQVGDQGRIYSDNFSAKVLDVQKQKDIFIHTVEIEKGSAEENKTYKLEVNLLRRLDTAKNHTATHLLHKALREVVGTHVQQAGSLVDPDKLRFDFSHYEAVTAEQLAKIENIVNEKIREGIDVVVSHHSIEEAKNLGAMMLFGDKYGEVVRVVDVPGFSTELCGGTHIDNIAKIGLFKIVSEGGIAAGVRRIEAKTGYGAYLVEKEEADTLKEIEKKLKASNTNIVEKVEKTLESLKDAEKSLETLKQKIALFETKAALSGMEEINGAKVLIATFKDKTADDLRTMIDTIKDNNEKAIVVLASTQDKLSFAVGVTKTLTDKVKAGDLVKQLAEMTGGKGGGRPDFAQAGGKDESKLLDALKEIRTTIETKLS
jgi:alanine--tRNA ligase